MKKFAGLFILLLITLIITSCTDSSKDDIQTSDKESTSNFKKRYGIKSGVIEYVLTGSQEGTKTLYFDDWGMRQAEYTRSVLSVGGFTKSINIVNIIDGEYQYVINMDQRSGTKTKNPVIKAIEELKDQKGFNEFGEQMLLNMGGNKIGRDEILGKECEVYEIGKTGTKLWVWEWVTLKEETNSGGLNRTVIAKKIDIGGSVPSSKFAVPEKVVLNEVDLENIENEMREANK